MRPFGRAAACAPAEQKLLSEELRFHLNFLQITGHLPVALRRERGWAGALMAGHVQCCPWATSGWEEGVVPLRQPSFVHAAWGAFQLWVSATGKICRATFK